jgi:hypothetical protein
VWLLKLLVDEVLFTYVEGVAGKMVYVSDELWTVMLHKLFVVKASYCSWFVEIGMAVFGPAVCCCITCCCGSILQPSPDAVHMPAESREDILSVALLHTLLALIHVFTS